MISRTILFSELSRLWRWCWSAVRCLSLSNSSDCLGVLLWQGPESKHFRKKATFLFISALYHSDTIIYFAVHLFQYEQRVSEFLKGIVHREKESGRRRRSRSRTPTRTRGGGPSGPRTPSRSRSRSRDRRWLIFDFGCVNFVFLRVPVNVRLRRLYSTIPHSTVIRIKTDCCTSRKFSSDW